MAAIAGLLSDRVGETRPIAQVDARRNRICVSS